MRDNAIDAATAAAYNSTFLLPSSLSSTFPSPFDQRYYIIDEPEGSHNSKGDIAE